MIIPSIDLSNGNAVQLVGGKDMAIDAGDPTVIADRFRAAGEIAVIDLDAARSIGSNAETIASLCERVDCRVGGGIRDVDTAIKWLDLGASKVILGTRAVPEILRELPRDRVIAALDADKGEVVVEGWTKKTGRGIIERVEELHEYVGGFLVTFVELEGRLGGTDLSRVKAIVEAAGDARVTIAGGVTTANEIAALDALGADAQVGMALYANKLKLADAIAAPMEGPGPWPVVLVDAGGVALSAQVIHRDGFERIMQAHDVLRIHLSPDRGSARISVADSLPSEWGDDRGLAVLQERIRARVEAAPEGSYTRRLLNDPQLLRAKLIEEAGELADAVDLSHVTAETADVLYFAFVAAGRAGVRLDAVGDVLERRARKVTRRPGNPKTGDAGPGSLT